MSKRMICYMEHGVVHEVDAVAGRVRVKFRERDLVSWWLPVNMRTVGADKYYDMYQLDDPVTCLMDEHCESGIVIGGSYTDVALPPYDSEMQRGFVYADGTSVLYDAEAGRLDINVEADVTVVINGAKSVHITGDVDLSVDGDVAADIGGDMQAVIGGDMAAEVLGSAKIESSNVEIGKGAMQAVIQSERFKVIFDTHVHMGNLGAPTSPPQVPLPTAVFSAQVKTVGMIWR